MRRTVPATLAFILLAIAQGAQSLTATIEVNEDPYYAEVKDKFYRGTGLTKSYEPFPVFFEGWKSAPREEIVDYIWDFGDGSERMRGFNGAHVYEEPGVYQATLTVRDAKGRSASDSITIEVLERDGTTYFVDAVLGDDANPGVSPGEGAWRTATHALKGMEERRYGPGDQILFKRGQTFHLWAGQVTPGHGDARWGYVFRAEKGAGPKPVLQLVGNDSRNVICQTGSGLAHFGFADLDFRLTSSEGAVAQFWFSTQSINNIYFLRVDVSDFNQGLVFSHGIDSRRANGIFVVNCTLRNSKASQLFFLASRLALLNNKMDLSENHIAYLTYINSGVIQGNLFARPAFGRHAMRISGGHSFETPTQHVWISNNRFEGWIDPLTDGQAHSDGTRYNWLLVHLAPNKPEPQAINDIVFEYNTLTNAEILLNVGSCHQLSVRRNMMSTVDRRVADRIVVGSAHGYDQRPLQDVFFEENVVISNEDRPRTSAIFGIRTYTGPEYLGQTRHEHIVIDKNVVQMCDGIARFLAFDNNELAELGQVVSNGNTIYSPTTEGLFECGLETIYSLAQWQNASGQDSRTVVTSDKPPLPATASSPADADKSSIAVAYDGAVDSNGTGLKGVHLWMRKGAHAWTDTGLSAASGSGSFSYIPDQGEGTYYFATQAEDNSGARSLGPSGAGTCATRFSRGDQSADDMAPSPGQASSPNITSKNPIAVAYSGADDEYGGSGLHAVWLWVKKGDSGSWADSGLPPENQEAGTLYYDGMSGDGVYYFALQAEDNAGNLSPVPTGDGQTHTLYDTTPPAVGLLSAAEYAKSTSLSLSYDGVTDEGSGLKTVRLWVKKGTGTWADTGLSATESKGTFSYPDTQGDDTYRFALQTQDHADNVSPEPSGPGQATVVLDTTPPDIPIVFAPAYTASSQVGVSYTGASDASGIKEVRLWARRSGSIWADTGLISTASTDTFSYAFPSGDGSYEFTVQAIDNAGWKSPAPALTTPAVAIYDTRLPTPAMAAPPPYATETPFKVGFSGASDSGSGLKKVQLWMRYESDDWVNTGQESAVSDGTFTIAGLPAEGSYYFATRALDNAGNLSPAPIGDGDGRTIYDTSAPEPGVVSSPKYSRTSIQVRYSDAGDAASGLKRVTLWVRKEGTEWIQTNLGANTPSGAFNYTPTQGNGAYYFATRAEDAAGRLSSVPDAEGGACTIYDTKAPIKGTVRSPSFEDNAPISISYSGFADGDGSGLARVRLWVKKSTGGAWTEGATSTNAEEGTFAYNGTPEDKLVDGMGYGSRIHI